MHYLKRPLDAPDVLRSGAAERSRRTMQTFMSLERERRSQTSPPLVGIAADDPDLVEAVARITHGRCAFCEVSEELFVHRVRPSGNALPLADRRDAHLFYVWLADAWQNLLPICRTCRPDDPVFPVEGARCKLPSPQQIAKYVATGDGLWTGYPIAEKPVLLDPERQTTFERLLKPRLDGSLVSLTGRAFVTIETFDLNREERRHQRRIRYWENIQLLSSVLGPDGDKPKAILARAWERLFDFEKEEFGGTWLLLLKRIAGKIDLRDGRRMSTATRRLRTSFMELAADAAHAADAQDRLARAIKEIEAEDPRLISVDAGPRAFHAVRAQLTSVQLHNFKAIERMHLRLPPPRQEDDPRLQRTPSLMILGENATGKSSILEAVALALSTEDAWRSLVDDWSTFALDPLQLGAEGGTPVKDVGVRLEFDGGQSARLTIVNDEPTVRTQFGSERVAVFAYGAFRRFSGDDAMGGAARHVRNLFDAGPLPNPENWLRNLDTDAFAMVVRTLRGLLSIEGDFDVIERAGRGRQLRVVTSVVGPDGRPRWNRTPLHAVSSGYRSMLGMLCDVLKGLLEINANGDFGSFEAARGIVLIDEIEAHLHPRWKVQVMTGLRKALPGMTFIVTTHDPLCLRGMDAGEVVVLQRVAAEETDLGSDLPIAVEQMSDLPDPSELRLEQLLTSDFFQLFSTDDAASERRMAQIGDLVRLRADGVPLSPEEESVLGAFERDIATALPVGSTEVHRMVQDAVATYLAARRHRSASALAELGRRAREDILSALETL